MSREEEATFPCIEVTHGKETRIEVEHRRVNRRRRIRCYSLPRLRSSMPEAAEAGHSFHHLRRCNHSALRMRWAYVALVEIDACLRERSGHEIDCWILTREEIQANARAVESI